MEPSSVQSRKNRKGGEFSADEEAVQIGGVMAEYKEKRAAMLRAVLDREDKERRDELVKIDLVPVQSISLDNMAKMSTGEKSKMRRAIFKNHEITASRA